MTHYAETTVLGGLPVSIAFITVGPDPEVGMFRPWIEDWWIEKIAGRKTKKHPEWIYRRISREQEERLMEELMCSRQEDF